MEGARALTSEPEAQLDDLLRTAGIRLNAAQEARLRWLVGRYGFPSLQAEHDGCRPSRLAILTAPQSGAAAELFYRSLQPGCAVVIPLGEMPGFDFLKTKLTEFGTVGPSAESPHEMWWGGIGSSRLAPACDEDMVRPRVVSYHRCGTDASVRALRQALDDFELDSHIEPIAAELDDEVSCFEKAEFIARMWSRYSEPLLFLEPGAILREAPLLPSSLGCDVALHKWNRWEMSARTLYLGRTTGAETLLKTWHHLAASYPSIWEGYLLDQAWSNASAHGSLDTVWLPRSYHALTGDLAAARATVVHTQITTTADLGPDPGFADLVRAARRAGRTGASDAFMVMASQAAGTGVTVIMHNVQSRDASAVAATVEAVTDAFSADCGGHGRLELSLCAWRKDVAAAREAARLARHHVLEISPGQEIGRNFFAQAATDARHHVLP